MKKVLFGTTTLVAFGLAGAANAADPITLKLGGKQEQYFGGFAATEKAGNTDGFGIDSDTEVYFTGSTTLDNGITVRAVIQMEATHDVAGGADEQYIDVSGGFGKIRAGYVNGMYDTQAVGAPIVGSVSLNDAIGNWMASSGNGATGFSGPIGTPLDQTLTTDHASVSYQTPSIFGFTGAVSYVPDAETLGNDGAGWRLPEPTGGSLRDQVEGSLAYSNEFGGVGVDASVGVIWGANAGGATASDMFGYGGGLSLSYAGFTLGGSYSQLNTGYSNFGAVGTGAANGHGYNVGVSYEVGPYGVGFAYGHTSSAGSFGDDANDTQDVYLLNSAYKMGPGISLVGNVFYAEQDSEGSNAPGTNNTNRAGVGVVTGLVLSF